MKPNRVYGVDFSGAKDAGRKIWIAGGVVDGDTLGFDRCQRAATLPGSGQHRERALPALCRFIVQQNPCIVGLDFPFGLPRELVTHAEWETFALTFGDDHRDADAFKSACWQAAGGKELRRKTDIDANTPFSPYNLRIYRQTYHGIRDVLTPLVRPGLARVLPMQPPDPDAIWLLEICPASTLKQMKLYRPYKGANLAKERDAILRGLEERIAIVIPGWVRNDVLNDNEGDALDSIVAAVATFRALCSLLNGANEESSSPVEGFVYV
jgi:hypothetical protein